VSVLDDADDDAELLVVVDTPLMLSLSFVATLSTTTTFSEEIDFLSPKTFDGSSRGKTSRDGVGVIWLGCRGSSDSDWSSLFSASQLFEVPALPAAGDCAFVVDETVSEFSASASENGAGDDDATQRRKEMMSSETRRTWLSKLKRK
jgi:hypothetical protein